MPFNKSMKVKTKSKGSMSNEGQLHNPTLMDAYIHKFPLETQKKLSQIRAIIKAASPQAEETINYQMPTFQLHGNLVHFAGYKNHIGFYPAPSAIIKFEKELSSYKNSKGAVQFPLSDPLPEKLIRKMVLFRVKENIEKAKEKSKKVCPQGHTFFKTSDCPNCPICAEKEKLKTGPFTKLSAPAQRALKNVGIIDLKDLTAFTEKEILALHGLGPGSLPLLKAELKAKRLSFKK
jgi:uncharacterized protein YdhG (YjbR/CyaY superfamily)